MLIIGVFVISCTSNEEFFLNKTNDKELSTSVEDNYIVFLKETPSSNSRKSNISYLVKQDLMKKDANNFAIEYKISKLKVNQVYGGIFNGFSIQISDKQKLDQIRNDPRILRMIKDEVVTLESHSVNKVEASSSSQSIPWGIKRVNGGVSYNGNNVAYILDSGIDLDHPDLNVNESMGFNSFHDTRNGSSLNDEYGHGTHVAGTIGAIDNAIGVVGVAAGATVIPVKVLDYSGSGTLSTLFAGIDFVAANGKPGDVANLSLGLPVEFPPLDEAVEFAASHSGVKFFLSAGNYSWDASYVSPARANGTNIYTISASDINDNFALFSNYGAPVDWCAPGVNIYSTYLGGGYAYSNGTSMAAPHAAGVYLFGDTPLVSSTVNGDPDGNSDPIISR
ncbi:S8 family peptidase [Flammeovirga aprica]|nr:S8 family serine peptidase [Flammeovirga aprica]